MTIADQLAHKASTMKVRQKDRHLAGYARLTFTTQAGKGGK